MGVMIVTRGNPHRLGGDVDTRDNVIERVTMASDTASTAHQVKYPASPPAIQREVPKIL